MDERSNELQRQYAHDVEILQRAVNCMYKNRNLYPIETYQVCKIFIDRATLRIESTLDQMMQRQEA